jgi:esterase/lipase superfamily enzyme
MQNQNSVVALFFTLLLFGCSSTPKLMPTPNIYTNGGSYPDWGVPHVLKNNEIDLLYATDRKRLTTGSEKIEYGAERSESVGFGSAIVRIGNDLSWQDLVKMSETRTRTISPSMSVISRNELGRFPATPRAFVEIDGMVKEDPEVLDKYYQVAMKLRHEINLRMTKSNSNEVHIFIHGFNNSFDWAAVSLAELWHFIGRHGVPLLYSWPAEQGGLFGYFRDRESGEFTIYHLKNLIRSLASFKEIERINILAHSRGASVATAALRELIIEARAGGYDPRELYRIENLIMAAPDLDFGIVGQRLMAEMIGPAFGQITVYTTDEDMALGFAQTLMSGTRFGQIRASDLGEQERSIFTAVKNVSFIDVQGVQSFIGHDYYLNNPSTSSDIIRVINNRSMPGNPKRPLIHKILNFWEMPVNYPHSAE